jgi:hypothetical protein
MEPPETGYAKSGAVDIDYQVVGDGPFDFVQDTPGYWGFCARPARRAPSLHCACRRVE